MMTNDEQSSPAAAAATEEEQEKGRTDDQAAASSVAVEAEEEAAKVAEDEEEEVESPSKIQKKISYSLFKELDTDGGGKLQKEEIEGYVESERKLWGQLQDTFGLEHDVCIEAAVRVCMELATERKGLKALKKPVNKYQFHTFRVKFVEDTEGNVEFFDRCMFAIFDVDGEGNLDEDELDRLLDMLYSGSEAEFFKTGQNPTLGDLSLPPRSEFKKELLESDKDGDGEFSLGEIRKYLGKLRKRFAKEQAKRNSERMSITGQVRAQVEAQLQADIERQQAEEEARRKAEEWDCYYLEWIWNFLGSYVPELLLEEGEKEEDESSDSNNNKDKNKTTNRPTS